MGLLELEIIVGDYIKENAEKMTYEDLIEFEEQIVDLENPILNQYLVVGGDPLPEHESKYMTKMKEYLIERKNNFGKYSTHL